MSYGTHRQGLYRTGWRPYSNPWHATQLGKTPFDADLWRLGQVRAMTAGGGYGLHGLGDIVPNGAVVEYQGNWATDINQSPSTMLAAVVAALRRDGFNVLASSDSGGFFGTLVTGSFSVTLHLQVSNGMGFGQPSDIASIVDHEAFLTTGQLPGGSTVAVITVPGSTPGVAADLVTGPTDWNSWLQQNAAWIGLAVLGVFVLPEVARKVL